MGPLKRRNKTRVLWRRRFAADQSGVSALEFALIAPVIAVMIAGLSETAFFIGENAKVVTGVDAALRHVMFDRGDVEGITETALIAGNLDADRATVTISAFSECSDGTQISNEAPCAAPTYRRDFVLVRVDHVYIALFPVTGSSDDPIIISRSGVVQLP